jgi:hypothetical protein
MRALMMATPGPRVSAAMAVARASGVTIVEGDVLHGLDVMTEHLAAATADHNRPWLPAAPWVPEAIRRGPEGLLSQSAAVYLSPSLAHRSAEVAHRFPGVPCIALVDCPALPALARPDADAIAAWLAAARQIADAAPRGHLHIVPLTRLHEPPVLSPWLRAVGGTLGPATVQAVAALAKSVPAGDPSRLPADVRHLRSILVDGAAPSPVAVGAPGEAAATVDAAADSTDAEDRRARWARALQAAGLDPEAAEAIAGARLLRWYTKVNTTDGTQ